MDHLAELRRKTKDLRRLQRVLAEMAAVCTGDQIPNCPIIDVLFESQPGSGHSAASSAVSIWNWPRGGLLATWERPPSAFMYQASVPAPFACAGVPLANRLGIECSAFSRSRDSRRPAPARRMF